VADDADALRRLTARLDEAAERAERLLSDSIRAVGDAPPADPGRPPDDAPPDRNRASDTPPADPGRPPPSGWQRPSGEAHDRWLDSDQLELLLGLVAGLRDRIPPELRERLRAAFRELLIAVRAVIDWYLERSDPDAVSAPEVRDIPIK